MVLFPLAFMAGLIYCAQRFNQPHLYWAAMVLFWLALIMLVIDLMSFHDWRARRRANAC